MKNFKFLVMILVVILISGACSKEDALPNSDSFVTLEQAIKIAKENLDNTITNDKKTSLRSDDFTPLNTISLDDDNNNPAIYIVNFRVNGIDYFNIISADARLKHILAFGEGIIENEDIVEGLNVWIQDQIKVIQQIRQQQLTLTQVVTEVIQSKVLPENDSDCCEACPNWPECDINPWIGCGDPNAECDPCDAVNNLTIVGPLISTEWGQGCFYNDDLGTGCTSNCMHELTGCVATAMSQVMRYHEHPNNYNWGIMLDNYTFSSTTPTQSQIDAVAALMLDAGSEVFMNWGCPVSGANTCGEVPGALTGFFNYSTANSCENYSNPVALSIKNEIDSDRPVLFRGSDDRGGHAWVSDGYRRHTICWIDDITGQLYAVTYRHYHMNWGWNGIANGWFDYSTWGGNFTTGQKVIKNIKP